MRLPFLPLLDDQAVRQIIVCALVVFVEEKHNVQGREEENIQIIGKVPVRGAQEVHPVPMLTDHPDAQCALADGGVLLAALEDRPIQPGHRK